MKSRRSAYEPTARQVAAFILETEPISFASRRMSKYAHWFHDDDQASLVAVVTPGEKATVIDEVMAYALAWQHDRDLLLVLPKDMVADALTRAAWIETEVRIWEHNGEGVPHPVPAVSRFQLLAHLRDLPRRGSKATVLKDEHKDWLTNIDTTRLTAHARSYLSWHHDGLQVLKMSETKRGLRIQAGVQYSAAPAGREPFDKVFDTRPTPGELAVINAKVQLAIEDGGSKTSQQREHKMQAALQGEPEILGLTYLWREFPVWRGVTGRPGYIDFLGVDHEGTLHVVETKIGHDPTVVLQALDYAIWVRANDTVIRETLKAQGHVLPDPLESVQTASVTAPIHLVLGAEGPGTVAFNGYLAGQIEALARDCRVTVHLTDKPTTSPMALAALPRRKMWQASGLVAQPVTQARWAEAITGRLLEATP